MFKKVIENFVCEHCGAEVTGNGFTNHCPRCLWSKHVDNDPGDRQAICGGLMEPVRVFSKREGEELLSCCVVCKKEKKNKILPSDNFDAVLEVSKKYAMKFEGR